jgi:hypothetical protein
MAQIGVQYPNLQQVFGESSMFPTALGMQQFDSAQKSEGINQQQALQDILFQQQNDPLKLQHASLANQGLQAGLPGLFADSSLKQDRAEVSRQSLGEQIRGEKAEQAAKLSASEVKQLTSQAEAMAMSQDPATRQMGAEILKHTKSMLEDENKQQAMQRRQIELEKVRGGIGMARDKQAIEAGKYAKSAGSGGGTASSINDLITSGKLTYEKSAAMFANAAFMAEIEGDPEKAAQYRAMAEEHNAKYVAGRRAAGEVGAGGKVNMDSMGMKTNGVPQPAPFAPVGRQAPAEAPKAPVFKSLNDLRSSDSRYKDIPGAKLRAAYKQKFGVDLP